MYEILTFIFAIIIVLDIYGMIRYGFNMVFLYIGIFSLVFLFWLITAIIKEKEKK